jgi:putative hydrolase of the HAD superfamily
MNKYKHYSFDLWLTIIKSNPSFKKERALLFYKEFNFKKKSIEEVEFIFRNVDLMCNVINEKTGKNIDSEEMYLLTISILNDYALDFSSIDLVNLYKRIEKILFNYPPTVYNTDTIKILEEIREQGKITSNILSNTAFIKGSSLRAILDYLNLTRFFDFQIYSDEVGFSKPNKLIFELMIDAAINLEGNTNLKLIDFIHIGDNVIADIEGAKKIGINTLQINSNENTILNLLY